MCSKGIPGGGGGGAWNTGNELGEGRLVRKFFESFGDVADFLLQCWGWSQVEEWTAFKEQ